METSLSLPLAGKRIGVVVESKFIPEEINGYRYGFATLGAQVEFVSRLNYGDHRPETQEFVSDVDPLDQQPWMSPEFVVATKDISSVNLDEYAALLMSANYTSVRLRYNGLPGPEHISATFNLRAHLQQAPAAQKFAEAMGRKDIVKGFLCHGLWILTSNPHLLKDRTVVCNEVVAADILNCGAKVDMSRRVIIDDDVVTGYSKHEVVPYVQAITEAILKRQSAP
jgi:deglycase